MGKYLRTALLQFKQLSMYKLNWYGWFIAFPLQLFMTVLLWKIVYKDVNVIGNYSFMQIINYYILSFVLMRVISPSLEVNYIVWRDINKGDLSNYLARPVYYGLFIFSKIIAKSIGELAIGVIVLTGCFVTSILSFSISINHIYFILSVLLSIIIAFTYQFIIGSLTFWMERIFGIRDVVFTIFMIFSGNLIPINLFPKTIQNISQLLPFQSIFYIPIKIAIERNINVGFLIIQQIIWIVILVIISLSMWGRGIKKYAAQGG